MIMVAIFRERGIIRVNAVHHDVRPGHEKMYPLVSLDLDDSMETVPLDVLLQAAKALYERAEANRQARQR
jgi:hypothetical protein